MNGVSANHIPARLLDRYAAAGAEIVEPDASWALEVHLESCAYCRERLAISVKRNNPAMVRLLQRVRDELEPELTVGVSAKRRHRPLMWAAPAQLPRLLMTVFVVLAAVGLDLADAAGAHQSLVLLVAPMAPLLAVAAAWSRGLDPAYELVVASPRAGLDMVLRRTAAVLAVVIPLLAVAGWLVGASAARWLLPCLAFTVGALALGELVGLHRAATALAALWAVAVVLPSLAYAQPPALLASASLPGWLAATVVGTLAIVLRRHGYTNLRSAR